MALDLDKYYQNLLEKGSEWRWPTTPQSNSETMAAHAQSMAADTLFSEGINRRNQMQILSAYQNAKMMDPAYWSSLFQSPSSGSSVTDTSGYGSRLQALMDNPDSIANSGAYKFRLNQGNQAIQRSAAAKGMLGSGNTLAALLEYGQGQASQEYGAQADRLAALRGQDLNLQAQQEQANLQARNNFFQTMMQESLRRADLDWRNANAPGGTTFFK